MIIRQDGSPLSYVKWFTIWISQELKIDGGCGFELYPWIVQWCLGLNLVLVTLKPYSALTLDLFL
jgi:hypothetical protein